MSATQEQAKKLKLNVTNIKSVLTGKRRVLHNKRRIKARIIDVNIKQQKQALRASGSGGKSDGGGTGMPGLDIMGMGLKFISGVLKFIGFLLVGVLVNNLPGIVNISKTAWKAVKPIVNLVWRIVKVVGRTMAAFGKFIVNLFNLGEAEENIKNTEKNNAELEEVSGELLSLPFLDEDLSGDDDEGDDDEPEDTEQTTDKAEVKPAATSTTPPSTSKRDELSKDGTGDKLVKDKPLPKDDTKAKKEQKEQETQPKKWEVVGITEKGWILSNGEKKKFQASSSRIHQKEWQKIKRPMEYDGKTYVVGDKHYDDVVKLIKLTANDDPNKELISKLHFKVTSNSENVTPVLKTTDIKSLGTEEQLAGEPTIIIMPMKETKVKKVPVGGGGGTIGGSSNPSKTNSNLKNAVI